MTSILLLATLAAAQDAPETSPEADLGAPVEDARPSTDDPYTLGYWQGQQDAMLRVDGIRSAAVGAGTGALTAGVGITCCGVFGVPLAIGGAVAPGAWYNKQPPIPPAGPWEDESEDYRLGYIQGYQEAGRQRQVRMSTAGAVAGTTVGVITGGVVLYAIGSQYGVGLFESP